MTSPALTGVGLAYAVDTARRAPTLPRFVASSRLKSFNKAPLWLQALCPPFGPRMYMCTSFLAFWPVLFPAVFLPYKLIGRKLGYQHSSREGHFCQGWALVKRSAKLKIRAKTLTIPMSCRMVVVILVWLFNPTGRMYNHDRHEYRQKNTRRTTTRPTTANDGSVGYPPEIPSNTKRVNGHYRAGEAGSFWE